MNTLIQTISAYREAHRIIWHGGIWKFLAVPILLTVLYLPVLLVGCVLLSGVSTALLTGALSRQFGELPQWLSLTLGILLFLGFGVLGVVTYRGVVMIFYAPVLDHLSERVEKQLRGQLPTNERPWTTVIVRILIMLALTLVLSALLLILNIFVSLIPVVGWLIAGVVLLPIQFFLAGIGYMDPIFDRNGYSTMESLRVMRGNFLLVTCFSLLGSLLLLLPLFGWFLGPTYSVIAGVFLGLELQTEASPSASEEEGSSLSVEVAGKE